MAAPSGSLPPPGFHAPSPHHDFTHDHKAFPIPEAESHASSIFAFADPFLRPIAKTFAQLQDTRQKLALPNPGTVEHLTREVKATHVTGHFFDGARADLTKAISINPIFQITHAFSHGSQNEPPSYNFGAVMGDEKTFLQGSISDSGGVTMRANRRLGLAHTAKIQAQFAAAGGQSFFQAEHDYQGLDHSFNLKAMNPSPADGCGIYMVNFIQSLTQNFAFGLETVYMRPSVDGQEANTGYMAKWTSDAKDAIATVQYQGAGLAQATYWQKLAEKVDAAVDLQVITAQGRREAQATVGAKWDYRMSTFRTQIDSTGKVSSLLETRLAPTFAFTVAGEIDHFKNAAKFGLGISIESAGEMPMDPNAPPPAAPSVPM